MEYRETIEEESLSKISFLKRLTKLADLLTDGPRERDGSNTKTKNERENADVECREVKSVVREFSAKKFR